MRSFRTLIAVMAVAGLVAGCGDSSERPASKPKAQPKQQAQQPKQKPKPKGAQEHLATVASVTSCLQRAHLPLDKGGGVPGDPNREKHLPAMGRPNQYVGAVPVAGSFADVWVLPSKAEAKDIEDTLGQDPETTKDYFIQSNGNVVSAIYAARNLTTDAASRRFDRCLNPA